MLLPIKKFLETFSFMKKYFFKRSMKLKNYNPYRLEDCYPMYNILNINNQLLIVNKTLILNTIKILVILIKIIRFFAYFYFKIKKLKKKCPFP